MKDAHSLCLLFVGLLAGGCSDTAEYQYDESVASLSFTGFFVYDAGTQCTVGGGTMHCCPAGSAMIGAHVNNNVFKCAILTSAAGTRFLDVGTQRNGMHACPPGNIMVGLHVNNNWLACQAPSPGPTFEFVDGTTQDAFPMHVCPSNFAMGGIHVGGNLFTCDL